MIILKPPCRADFLKMKSVFLAGSIENGTADNWQDRLQKLLSNQDIFVINPRRDNWDFSLVQRASNPVFREQVEWELDMLKKANVIAIYLDPNTKSPISLLELGLNAASRKVIVCCPDGFWRKGNVEIVCERFGIKMVDSLEKLADDIIEVIREMNMMESVT